MVRNLKVNAGNNIKIDKILIHNLVKTINEKLDFEISSLIINFIPSNQILDINRKYLKHNYTTDIITFNYSGSHKLLDGELYISGEDAQYNAGKYGVSLIEEYFRLVIHGILHLMNYDDRDKKDRISMKRLENNLVKQSKNKLLKGINFK